MSATATIEEINGEQIATRTDLLLMRARGARARLSSNKLAFANDVMLVARVRASRPVLELQPDQPDQPDQPEHTLFMRVRRVGTSTTSAAILATLFAIAIVLTSFL